VGVKRVELVLVEYTDQEGLKRTQLGLAGDRNLTMLKGQPLGLTNDRTEPTGFAPKWLRDAVFKTLGKMVKDD
jgi:hypothetical protein